MYNEQMADCGGGDRVAALQSTKLLQSVRRGDVTRLEAVLRRGVPQLVNRLHPVYASSALIVAASQGKLCSRHHHLRNCSKHLPTVR